MFEKALEMCWRCPCYLHAAQLQACAMLPCAAMGMLYTVAWVCACRRFVVTWLACVVLRRGRIGVPALFRSGKRATFCAFAVATADRVRGL